MQASWYNYWWPLKKQNILNASCLPRKSVFVHEMWFSYSILPSWKLILIQLHPVASSSLLSLCKRFDMYCIFLTTAVKSQTEAQQMICFPSDPSGLCLSACGWVITRMWGWRKLAYLISWASDSKGWDRKVSSVPNLPPQIVALSRARVYLLHGGGGEMTR